MVLLTITPSIVEAIQTRNTNADAPIDRPAVEGEPTLKDPAVGKAISHAQIIDLWKDLREHNDFKYSLELLVRGSSVYIPPPPPKPEPVCPPSSSPLLPGALEIHLD